MAPRSRSEFVAAISKDGERRGGAASNSAPPINLAAMAAAVQPNILDPVAPPAPKPDGGFLGPLGKAIEIIDTPRAAIVSGVKELTDMFQGEGFSASDWWDQTADNMMFGEVLEDWDLKTGNGWLDAAIGFVGDVALDPLTYLAPASLALRGARSGETALALTSKAEELRKLAKAASASGKTAEAAKLTERASKLTSAAVKVTQAKGASTAAGAEALAEIGLDVGWRSTVFGTGRVGRGLVEKPLNMLSGGKLTKALDVRRARQVPEWIGAIKVGASADEVADAMRLLRAGDTATFRGLSEGVRVAAQRASKMPVQSKRFLGVVPDFIAKDGVLPWGTKMIQAVLPAPGRALRAATQRGMIKTLDAALNTKQPIRALLSSKNPDMVLSGIELRRANNGRIRVSSQFKTQLEPLIEEVVLTAKRLGVTGTELQEASEMPFLVPSGPFGVALNPNLPAVFKSMPFKDAQELHGKSRAFWELAREVFNDLAGEEVLKEFADDMYAARYLGDDGRWSVFNSQSGRGGIPLGGKQSPLHRRTYLTVTDFRQKLDEFVEEQTARSASGVQRKWADLTVEEQEKFEALFRASGVTDEFMGVQLASTREGVSVRQQMIAIGENRVGVDVFTDMYEGDFLKVGSRYLRSMADEAGRMHMVNQLADSGVLFKDPSVFMGDRLARLTSALKSASNNLSSAQSKAAVMAQAAEEGVDNAGQQQAALLAEVSILQDRVSGLVAQADGARDAILEGGARYAEVLQPLTTEANEAAAALASIDELFSTLQALNSRVTGGATGTGDWITVSLTQQIQDVEAAIRSLNARTATAAGLDDSVQQLQDILGVLRGHDPSSAANSQIKDWSGKMKRVEALTAKVGDAGAIVQGEQGSIAARQAELVQKIDDLAVGRGTVLDPEAVAAVDEALEAATGVLEEAQAQVARLEGELGVRFAAGAPEATKAQVKAAKDQLDIFKNDREELFKRLQEVRKAYGRNSEDAVEMAEELADLDLRLASFKAANKELLGQPTPKSGGGMTRKARAAKEEELAASKARVGEGQTAVAKAEAAKAALIGSEEAAENVRVGAQAVESQRVFDEAMLGPVGTDGKRPYSFRGDGRYGDAPKVVRTAGTPKGEVFQPTGVPFRVNKVGKVVPNQPFRAEPKPVTRRVPEGQLGIENAINENKRLAQREYEAAAELLKVRQTVDASVDAARAEVLDIEAQIQRMRADIRLATDSDSLTQRMSALDNTHAAVKEFNDLRALRGFQEMYSSRINQTWGGQAKQSWGGESARPWGMSGYEMVASKREDAELMNAVFQSLYRVNDESAMKDFFSKYDKFMGWWKAGAVSSPGGFSMRNFLGGSWINTQIAGVEMGQHSKVWGMYKLALKEGDGDLLLGAKRLREAGETRRLKGTFGINRFRNADAADWDIFDQIVQSGVARSGQVAGEIDTSLESLQKMFSVGGRLVGRWSPASSEFIPFYQLRNVNEQVEFMLRGALGLDVMQKGGTLDDAVESILKYHFDYSPESLTLTERHIRRVIPFWRWQKNVIPVLVESMGRKPQAWSRLLQAKKELELGSEGEGVVPDYFAENWGVRLPFTAQGNQVYTLPDMPWRSLVQITKEPTSPMRTIGEMMAPPLKLPIEIWSKKQVFADIPFTGRFQQAPIVYDEIPFLMESLGALGKAKKNSKGEWKIRDHDIYIMDQMMPFLGRFRRMAPNESRYESRIVTTWLSQVFGISVRLNTRHEKANQIRRNNEDFSEMIRDKIDSELRNI